MKILIAIALLLAGLTTSPLRAQVYSDITYDAGSSVEVQTGADVCADQIIINGSWSGGGTICTGALPVSLSSFTASADKRNVTLMWVTEWELNNLGFRIERLRIDENIWKEISFIQGKGTSNIPNGYMHKDEKLKTGSYRYRLKQIDYSGSFEYFYPGSDVMINPPGKFELGQNYPNPSNPNSKINFELPVSGKVTLKIYDILGKEVKTIVNGILEADFYSVDFDGSMLASGVYFYRLDAEGDDRHFSKTVKMILVK